MTSADLRIERVGYGHPDALLLIEQVQQVYVERYGGTDDTPLDAAMFEPPGGSFFVGYLDDAPAASGAWRRRSDVALLGVTETAEIKRMYVAAAFQRRGLARVMLAHLESTAREAGADAIILETGAMQPEAIALYLSSGYEAVPSFGHYRDSPENRCFGKLLRGPTTSPLGPAGPAPSVV